MSTGLFAPYVSPLIALAVAVDVCAGIVGIGYLFGRYEHAVMPANGLRVPAQGLWFCVAGQFGNGCWQ